MTYTKERIFMAGNRGVGKSTLLNSFIGRAHFRSGRSKFTPFFGALHSAWANRRTLTVAPGLEDARIRTNAASIISSVLGEEGGKIKFFFVMTLESGSVRPVDVTTMHQILDALVEAGLNVNNKFSIIMNKVPKRVEDAANREYTWQLFTRQMQIKYRTTHIIMVPFDPDAYDAMDYLLPKTQKFEEFKRFVESSPFITIKARSTVKVRADLYEKTLRRVTEMMHKEEGIPPVREEAIKRSQRETQARNSQFQVEEKTSSKIIKLADTKGRIVMAGNLGVGKSTLLNSLVDEEHFKSGTKTGTDVIPILQAYRKGDWIYVAMPGLDDVRTREAAAKEISTELSVEGNMKLIFVMVLEDCELRAADLTHMLTILDAITETGLDVNRKFSVLVNKVSEGALSYLHRRGALRLFRKQLQLKYLVNHVELLPFDVQVHDAENYVVADTRVLEDFIESSPSIKIEAGSRVAVTGDSFAENSEMVVEKMFQLERSQLGMEVSLRMMRSEDLPKIPEWEWEPEWSGKRYDIFLSFRGDDFVSFKGGGGESVRSFLKGFVLPQLHGAWARKGGVGKLSIFFDEYDAEEHKHKEAMQGILRTRGGGVFLSVITKNYFTHTFCVAELEEAAKFFKYDNLEQETEHIQLVLVSLDMDVEVVTKAVRQSKVLKTKKIDEIKIWHFRSDNVHPGVLARHIAGRAIGPLANRGCVVGGEINESFGNLLEAISLMFPEAEPLSRRLFVKRRMSYSSSLEVLLGAWSRLMISERNVDKLLKLLVDEGRKFVESYKGKWLDYWTNKSWDGLLYYALEAVVLPLLPSST